MNVKKENLIEFINIVNECCDIMPEDKVADWLLRPNRDLNDVGRNKILRLLYFIEIGEADLL